MPTADILAMDKLLGYASFHGLDRYEGRSVGM
jgi:hypothetical protein